MITVICLNSKNDLEVIVASRLGYERENKRFFFEMMGSPVVYYYENITSEMAGSAIKIALKQGGTNLKDFGPYKIQAPERPHVAPKHERSCPKAAPEAVKPTPAPVAAPASDTTPVRKPREGAKKEESTTASMSSFMEKMGKVVDGGMKKIKSTMQEVAVVAEEEDKKDKERAAARRAEWNAKKVALEEKVEERRARRAAEKAARMEDDDDDEVDSEFDEFAQGVAAAADASVDAGVPISDVQNTEDSVVTDTVAGVMANKQTPASDNDLREITQLNLDFGDMDDVLDDIMSE